MFNQKLLSFIGLLFVFNPAFAVVEQQSAEKVVNSFEQLFGITEGQRRNHTKGFCFVGEFIPKKNSGIELYSKSVIFTNISSVIGRLSHKGGNYFSADNKPAEYGLGLSMTTALAEKHNMSMNTLDFFPVATPEEFAELMLAKVNGGEAIKAFKAKNESLQHFKAHMAKKTKTLRPYEASTFNSINSFYLVNHKGGKTAVRWSFVPVQSQGIVLTPKQDFFFDNMQKNLQTHGIEWHMVITLANADDEINNPAIAWQGQHKKLVVATLKVTSIEQGNSAQCQQINYDPMVLSAGFQPSDDPLLKARQNAYAISFARRLSEQPNKP